MLGRPFWEIEQAQLIDSLSSNYNNGLTTTQAKKLIRELGLNVIKEKKLVWLMQLLSRFKNPLILILIVVGVISFYLQETPSLIIISVITVISVTLDFYQEYKAVNAIESLKKLVVLKCTVLRDGLKQEITVDRLVPGDIILLSNGDRIPADCRLLESKNLLVNQSLLTGETYNVEKIATNIATSSSQSITDIKNSVFMGSTITEGTAKAIVCNTGRRTEFGKIASAISSKTMPTSFELEIRGFGLFIMRISILCSVLVLLVNVIKHKILLESFVFAIALAIGITPELLPMILTVTMAAGVKNMAKKKLIVKRLVAMQNIGSMNLLCVDKTGTLTEGTIILKEFINPQGGRSEEVLKLAYLNSFFQQSIHGSLDKTIVQYKTFKTDNYNKIDEIPFDFERRMVSVILENSIEKILIAKGSPETVIACCSYYKTKDTVKSLDYTTSTAIQNSYNNFAKVGYRTLAVAYKIISEQSDKFIVSDENELVFAGLITFVDPIKPSSKEAVSLLSEKGVRIKIITGDSELVAKDVCNKLGLNIRASLGGHEMQSLDDASFIAKVEQIDLFYMISPTQKSRILMALKERGHIVGYLGDGINDAPSLHIADIGIAVNNAADVAKEAADIVMLSSNLTALHTAILIGRKTYANIMKYLMATTSSNFGNMISTALASLFLPFLPMLPVQILLNNLLYDISEISLPIDEVDSDSLKSPKKMDIRTIYKFMLVFGSVSSIFDLISFYILFYIIEAEPATFRTAWFLQSIISQTLIIFILRTRNNLCKSKPSLVLSLATLIVNALAFIIIYSPVASIFGFVDIKINLVSFILYIVSAYLIAVRVIRRKFF